MQKPCPEHRGSAQSAVNEYDDYDSEDDVDYDDDNDDGHYQHFVDDTHYEQSHPCHDHQFCNGGS